MIPIPWLGSNPSLFPPLEQALHYPNGLLAAGGDLSPTRLVNAYARGIFPWYEEGQDILWWSPDPRTVVEPRGVHISRSLRKTLKKERFQVTCDTAFEQVIDACAAPRAGQEGTWITPAMRAAYLQLHRLGIAHSVEVWHEGQLVGGLYGPALGRVFFGESMFCRMTDASKVGFVTLSHHLAEWGFELIDCQVYSRHLASLGAVEIPRSEFAARLAQLTGNTSASLWRPQTKLPPPPLSEGSHRADKTGQML